MSQILCAWAKTRTRGHDCSSEHPNDYRTISGLPARLAQVPEKSFLCNKHRYQLAKDDFCCCPSTKWEHSTQKLHKCPKRLFPLFDSLGENNPNYRPGTKICTTCNENVDQEYSSHPLYQAPLLRKVRSNMIHLLNTINIFISQTFSVHFFQRSRNQSSSDNKENEPKAKIWLNEDSPFGIIAKNDAGDVMLSRDTWDKVLKKSEGIS